MGKIIKDYETFMTEAEINEQNKTNIIRLDDFAGGTIDLSDYETIKNHDEDMLTKQDTLISGTNIKTINNQDIIGEGNIEIEGNESIKILKYDLTPLNNGTQIILDKSIKKGSIVSFILNMIDPENQLFVIRLANTFTFTGNDVSNFVTLYGITNSLKNVNALTLQVLGSDEEGYVLARSSQSSNIVLGEATFILIEEPTFKTLFFKGDK